MHFACPPPCAALPASNVAKAEQHNKCAQNPDVIMGFKTHVRNIKPVLHFRIGTQPREDCTVASAESSGCRWQVQPGQRRLPALQPAQWRAWPSAPPGQPPARARQRAWSRVWSLFRPACRQTECFKRVTDRAVQEVA
jgi:hypothetical protein